MKKYTIVKRLVMFALLSHLLPESTAQLSTDGFDSLIVVPQKKKALSYFVDHPDVQEINLRINKIKNEKTSAESVFGGIARTSLAMLIGSWSGGADMEFVLPCELRSSVPNTGWNIFLYVQGVREKSSERVRNSDGSKSIETTKKKILYWERGSWGILVAHTDTVARFAVSIDPLNDPELMKAARKLLQKKNIPEEVEKKKKKFSLLYPPEGFMKRTMVDYGLFGTFREHQLLIIYGVEESKGWIFWDNELQAVFKNHEFTDPRRPAYSTSPYILIRPGLNEQKKSDLIRLALFSSLMEQSVKTNTYEE